MIQTPRRRETGRSPTAQFTHRPVCYTAWMDDKAREEQYAAMADAQASSSSEDQRRVPQAIIVIWVLISISLRTVFSVTTATGGRHSLHRGPSAISHTTLWLGSARGCQSRRLSKEQRNPDGPSWLWLCHLQLRTLGQAGDEPVPQLQSSARCHGGRVISGTRPPRH
jgi:hypothetical protein